jgi:SET domain-containing protein
MNDMAARRIVRPPHLVPKQVEVRPSPLHGSGLFTLEPIRKGQYVISYEGHVTRGFKSIYILHIEEDNGRYTKIMGTGDAKHINHSSKPNLELDDESETLEFYALRHIKAGEELTWYYGDEFSEWLAKEKAR